MAQRKVPSNKETFEKAVGVPGEKEAARIPQREDKDVIYND